MKPDHGKNAYRRIASACDLLALAMRDLDDAGMPATAGHVEILRKSLAETCEVLDITRQLSADRSPA